MPWRGAEEPGEFPTLGYLVADWIQEHCVVPDGEHQGEPYVLTDEMLVFLLWHYRLHPGAVLDRDKPRRAFAFRRSQLVRPQKWGKGPFASAIICAEADGPVLFDGWDAEGEPVGRPWSTPWIQVTSVSLDSTDNVWRALVPMIDMGPLADIIWDTGETRINLRGRGLIQPVSSSADSRIGQRITFALQDETHLWRRDNGGWKLADAQRRNLAGMGGRSLETTNAWDPAEESVAQRTSNTRTNDVHRDHRLPPNGSVRNKRELRKKLTVVYGDAWWVDLEAIEGECSELAETDVAQAERFFCNDPRSGAGTAFDSEHWRTRLARPEIELPSGRGELVVIGFDGARFHDSTALIATHIESGLQWPLGMWEQPEILDEEWEIPAVEVTAALEAGFDTLDVWRVYADPPYWDETVDSWAGRWGEKRIIRWYTSRPKQMAYAVRSYAQAQKASEITHNGDERLARHIANCRRRLWPGMRDDDGRPLWTIQKERPGSPNKIDGASAATLSWEARGDAIASGALKRRSGEAAGF